MKGEGQEITIIYENISLPSTSTAEEKAETAPEYSPKILQPQRETSLISLLTDYQDPFLDFKDLKTINNNNKKRYLQCNTI